MWRSAFRCGEMACTPLPAFLSLRKKHETEDCFDDGCCNGHDIMWHS